MDANRYKTMNVKLEIKIYYMKYRDYKIINNYDVIKLVVRMKLVTINNYKIHKNYLVI